ncbi:FAD-dependent monooxygenase [Candidatus Mycobacterium wuenschmannii]|uniref:FAD-dependent monooxygenase n=1 Tax=Candidatus Mycobacterium wuenschmannii TaxID=3027808 RepID=A0ABY8W2V8_9MYCO|nr:FAD-dependent monooxygenase [Candidatus Mycobacterium wuenschmannii]WIM90200.1 FAD-dependent monooxygenase [Candidatus Mycobacterium wuenschmannii]
MLAAELALAGIDVAIVERRASQELRGLRAGGLHARTIEVLDQRGIADRFLACGQVAQLAGFAQIRLDIGDFPTRHPYGLALWQSHIERILGDWVDELGVPIYRGREVLGITQDATGVDVLISGDHRIRAGYLAGCDGGRSAVRKSAGIDFAGWDATMSYLLAEVELSFDAREEPEWGIRHDAVGVHALSAPVDGGPTRVMVTEAEIEIGTEPGLDDLRRALVAVFGSDYGIHSPTWIFRATDMARQAVSYRAGRVLLAGDSAHVHHPIGGQGLNTGIQDAVNLGWKLAAVVSGAAPDSLLDSYHAERHPIGARVLRNTMAQMHLLRRPDDARSKALRDIMSDLLTMGEPRRRFAAMMSGLDIHYDLGAEHPLVGRRMPDVDLIVDDEPVRVFTLLHGGRAALVNLGDPGTVSVSGWADRLRVVDAKYPGPWELPAIGTIDGPSAVLIRPDGHVAWVGAGSDAGLTDALHTWLGPAT